MNNSKDTETTMLRRAKSFQRLELARVLFLASLLSLAGLSSAQEVQKLPDCCIKAAKEGKACQYFPVQPLKAGALGFKLNYVSLFTQDVGRLYEFYRQVLKLDVKDVKELWKGNNPQRYVEIPTQASVLSLTYSATVDNANSNILLEFGTPDNLNAEYERIKGLGVKMKEGSKGKNEFKFYDPDGNLINFYWDPHTPLRNPRVSGVNAEVIAKKPECCIEAERAGTNCDYALEPYVVPFPPKVGAQAFRLSYISLFTKEVPKMYNFYKAFLRVEAKDVKELWSGNNLNKYVEIPTQKAVLSFTQRTNVSADNNVILLEMECQDNLEKEYQRLKALGVKMKEGSKNKNEFKCYDPDGNLINVYHYCLNFYRQIPNSD